MGNGTFIAEGVDKVVDIAERALKGEVIEEARGLTTGPAYAQPHTPDGPVSGTQVMGVKGAEFLRRHAAGEASRNGPSVLLGKDRGYFRDRTLDKYRSSLSTSLTEEPVANIQSRLRNGAGTVDVLDAGTGEGIAAAELKALFGDRIHLDTNDLQPLPQPAGDRHIEGDFLAADFGRSYDLILTMYGAHSYLPEGRLIEGLQKTASLLKPGGEFIGGVTIAALKGKDGRQLATLVNSLPLRLEFLKAGLVLTVELGMGGYLIYMKRLGPGEPVDIRSTFENFEDMSSEDDKWETQVAIEEILKDADISVDGITLRADPWDVDENDRLRRNIAYRFSELYFPVIVHDALGIVRVEFARFLDLFLVREGRRPTEVEVSDWARGGLKGLMNPFQVVPLLMNVVLRMAMEGRLMLK